MKNFTLRGIATKVQLGKGGIFLDAETVPDEISSRDGGGTLFPMAAANPTEGRQVVTLDHLDGIHNGSKVIDQDFNFSEVGANDFARKLFNTQIPTGSVIERIEHRVDEAFDGDINDIRIELFDQFPSIAGEFNGDVNIQGGGTEVGVQITMTGGNLGQDFDLAAGDGVKDLNTLISDYNGGAAPEEQITLQAGNGAIIVESGFVIGSNNNPQNFQAYTNLDDLEPTSQGLYVTDILENEPDTGSSRNVWIAFDTGANAPTQGNLRMTLHYRNEKL
jgi:hypothetical protein